MIIRKVATTVLFLVCLSFASAQTLKKIAPNDSGIYISGAPFSKYSDERVLLQRHSDAVLAMSPQESQINPEKAKTTTGIVIAFKTKSPTIRAHFQKVPGVQRSGSFAVFQDGVKISDFTVNNATDSSFGFAVRNIEDQREPFFEITLPTWNNLAFTGLEIDSAYDLIDWRPAKKKLYVAYGNSITHGTGQKGTHETYAFLTARRLGWELCNVAVGGGRTSVAVADMLRDEFEHIDYMTVLIGYNDYNFQGLDTTEYKARYAAVLNSIREKHQATDIFCITQTHTRQDSSKTSGLPIDGFRTALTNLVRTRRAAGDEHLYLIRGERMTSAADLKDQVHFTVNGAALFADSLASRMRTLLPPSATEVHDKKYGANAAGDVPMLAFSIYPNPARDYISVAAERPPENIRVFNILGQTVISSRNSARLSLAGLPRGTYFVQLTNARGLFAARKFVLR